MEPFFKHVPRILFNKSVAVLIDLVVVTGMAGGPQPVTVPKVH